MQSYAISRAIAALAHRCDAHEPSCNVIRADTRADDCRLMLIVERSSRRFVGRITFDDDGFASTCDHDNAVVLLVEQHNAQHKPYALPRITLDDHGITLHVDAHELYDRAIDARHTLSHRSAFANIDFNTHDDDVHGSKYAMCNRVHVIDELADDERIAIESAYARAVEALAQLDTLLDG